VIGYIGLSEYIAGAFPYSLVKGPLMHTAFETEGFVAAGIKAGLEVRGDREATVLTWAGDGGTLDIGLQALSGAVERNDDFIYACYDNGAYMNTGIQRSSGTPWGAWATTPVQHPNDRPKKDIVAIMAAHRIAYTATATVAYPEDLVRKFQKASAIRGAKFIHIFYPCPPSWKMEPAHSIRISRLAVESKVFSLYEVENGEKWIINVQPKREVPVREYLKLQGRFSHLSEADIEFIQGNVDREWERLIGRAGH